MRTSKRDFNFRKGRLSASNPGFTPKEMIMNAINHLRHIFALLAVLFVLPLLAGCASITVTHELGAKELKLAEAFVGSLYTSEGKTLADVLEACSANGNCPDLGGLEPVQNEDGSVSLCDSDGDCYVECRHDNWRPDGCNCSNKPHRRNGNGNTTHNGNDGTTWVKYPGGRPRQPAQPAQNPPPVQVASGDSSATGTGTGTGGSAWASGTGGQGGNATGGNVGDISATGGQGGNATATGGQGGQAWASGGNATATGGQAWQHQNQDAHAEALAYANSSLTLGNVMVFLEIDVPQPEIHLTIEGDTVEVQVNLPLGMSIEECNWCDLYVRYRLSCLEEGDCVAAVLQYLLDRCMEQANPPTAQPTNPGQPTARPTVVITDPPPPTARPTLPLPTNPPPTAVPSETPRQPTAVPTDPPPTAVPLCTNVVAASRGTTVKAGTVVIMQVIEVDQRKPHNEVWISANVPLRNDVEVLDDWDGNNRRYRQVDIWFCQSNPTEPAAWPWIATDVANQSCRVYNNGPDWANAPIIVNYTDDNGNWKQRDRATCR